MSIFKIGRIGTKEISVEEATNARAACYKAGWAPEQCEVSDITDQVIVLNENGGIKGIKNKNEISPSSSIDTRFPGHPTVG